MNNPTYEIGERVIWTMPDPLYPPEETTITDVFTMDESTMCAFPGELFYDTTEMCNVPSEQLSKIP